MGTYQRVRVTGAAVTTKAGGETEIGGRDMEVWSGIEKCTFGGSTFAVTE